VNPANEGHRTTARPKERGEGRGLAKENLIQQNSHRTQSRAKLQSALDRIRQAAQKDKGLKFTSLWHHVYDVDRLREAYLSLKRQAAPGIDGQTWEEYGKNLESNLQSLSERLARGAYHAKAVKRAYVPKADGQQRPIGIPTLEDKLVQRSTAGVLNAIYETDFRGFSYGFRPGRKCHDALDALHVGIHHRKVSYVLDADIRGFFDALNHEWLIKFVEHRIADQRLVRHIKKWLNAGVLEDGVHREQEEGTPQGGSISPLLANIYLHYVFDLWADQWRKTHAQGDVIIVRYADDFVVGFQYQSEAERFLADLRERFRQFNLELHADKTRIIEFGRFAASNREERGQGKPETFNFLGFTHICGKSRAGWFKLVRQTMARRMRAKLATIARELRKRIYRKIQEVGPWLASVVRGHYQYYGVPGNFPALAVFNKIVCRHWQRALSRRSQKGYVTLPRMDRLCERWLPSPRICHPYPNERLCVAIQGKSPVR
jgi:group II intron reverse transcriptase/maturase